MALLPRIQAFEFNDSSWVPASLRDTLIETLSRSLDCTYSEQELRAFVEPLGDGYGWTYGTYDYPFGGRGCYFQGLPM